MTLAVESDIKQKLNLNLFTYCQILCFPSHTYGGGGGGLLQRQDSLVSQVSSTTTITNTRWQTRPVELWENEDLMDWAEAAGFEELADVLHGGFCKLVK